MMQLILVPEALLIPSLVRSIEKCRQLLVRDVLCLYSGALACHLRLSIVLLRRSSVLHVERVDTVVSVVQRD